MHRYADDEDMNDELKERERWNDPAAAFLTVSHSPLSISVQDRADPLSVRAEEEGEKDFRTSLP